MKRPSYPATPALLRRLRSLATVPLGLFVVLHVWEHAGATAGQPAYDERVRAVQLITGHLGFWVSMFYLPLALHAAHGLRATTRLALGKGDASKRTWTDLLHHAAGVITLLFLAVHVWHLWVRAATRPLLPEDYFHELAAALSSTTAAGIPVMACAYLVGMAAVSYHLAQGFAALCASSGLCSSPRAERIARWGFGVLGVVVFLLGARTVLYFATGS